MGTHPQERVRTLVVTTPANTAIAAAISTTWVLGRGVLGHLDVVIPDGHVGLTGLAIIWGGRQLLPYEGGEWLRGNADEITVTLELDVFASVTVLAFNADVFPHSHYLRAYLHDRSSPPSLVLPSLGGVLSLEGLSFRAPLEQTPLADVWSGADVTAEEFLADLRGLFSAFLDALDARLGGPGAGAGGEGVPPGGQPPGPVAIPRVIGLMVSGAVAALETIGFAWTETDQESASIEGTVLAQDPSAGTQADPATTTVALTVAVPAPSSAPVTVKVPHVVGMLQGDAATRLRGLGLRVEAAQKRDRSAPRHQVLRQSPQAGTTVALGFVVRLTVATWA